MRSYIFIALVAAVSVFHSVSVNAQDVAQQAAPQTQQSQTLSDRELATLMMAAEKGDVASQARLGEEYAYGTSIAQNYGYAYFWLTVVKINGNSDYDTLRMQIQKLMTHDSAEAIRARAHSWKPGEPVTIMAEADPVAAPTLTPEAAPQGPLTESDMSYGQQLKMRFRRWWNGLTMDY